MRNLKKLLAVVVAFCVLATMSLSAFAAETTAPSISADAQICKDLGVLKGDTAAGVDATYLAKGTTRLQAAQLYLRLIGKEADALAFTGTDNFADSTGIWAGGKAVMAYLKANPDLGWQGIGNNKFDPQSAATAQMIYKVALEALGYKTGTDFQYADTITFGAGKGLSKIADVATLTNDSTASALVEVLKATLKDGSKTLAADLVAKGVITQAAAEAAGVVAAAKALDVSSVKAISNTVVGLTLGTDCAAADATAAVITVKDAAGAALAVTSASRYAEKDVRVVVAAMTKNTKYTLTLDGKSYDFIGLGKDTVAPKVTATAVAKGYTTVDVTFDKALDKASAETVANYAIDKSMTVSKAVLQSGDKVVRLTTSEQTAGTLYTITVTGVKSADGVAVGTSDNTAKFGGIAKLAAPKVTSTGVTQSNTKVKVIFNQDLDKATAENIANYAIDNGLTVTKAELITDSAVANYNQSVYLTTSAQTAGKLYTITVTGVQNVDLVAVGTSDNTAKFGGMAADTTAPKATSTAVTNSNTAVTVSFDDELDEASAETVANYAIDNGLTVTKAELQTGNKSVKLTTSAQTAGKLYTITVTGVKNVAGIVIGSSDNTAKFGGVALDTVGPAVSSAYAALESGVSYVYVTFDKALDTTSATVPANYAFDKDLGYATDATIVANSGNKQVKLKTADQAFNTLYTLTVSLVKSADGVVVKSDANTKAFAGVGADTKPETTSAIALNKNAVKVTFNTTLSSTPAATGTNYTLVDGSGVVKATATAATYDNDTKSVTVYFTTPVTDYVPFTAGTIYTLQVNATNVVNARGTAQSDTTKVKVQFAGVATDSVFNIDYIMPVNDKTIDVYFNDTIDNVTNPLLPAEISIKGGVNGDVDTAFQTYTASMFNTPVKLASNGKVYRLTLATGKFVAGRVYTLQITDAAGKFMSVGGIAIKQDATTNKTDEFQFGGSSVASSTPAIDSIIATDVRTLKVTFKTAVSDVIAHANDNTAIGIKALTTGDANYSTSTYYAPAVIQADSADNIAYKFFFDKDLVPGNLYEVKIFNAVADVTTDSGIAQDADITGTVAGINTSHDKPAVSTVDVANDRKTVTVTLNHPVTSIAGVAYDGLVSKDLSTANLQATFEIETGASVVYEDGSTVANTDITQLAAAALEWDKDGKTVKFVLPKALKGSSIIKIRAKTNNIIDFNAATSKLTSDLVAGDYVQSSVPADVTGIAGGVIAPSAKTIAPGASITITFSEILSDSAKTAIQSAILATPNATLPTAGSLAFSWTNNVLTVSNAVTNTGTASWAADITIAKALVTDAVGNAAQADVSLDIN